MRTFAIYLLVLAALVGAVAVLLHSGAMLPVAAGEPVTPRGAASADGGLRILLVQIVVTLIAAHGLGAVVHRLGQPRVVGEIAGGILLGPTVLGQLSPELMAAVFPPQSTGALKLVADVGIVLFMFRVGLEVDLQTLGYQLRRAVVISHVSIAVPFVLGVVMALGLYGTFAPAGTPFMAFALFLGIAMAITAFPVLARILTDRGIATTALGRTALTCAAVDDVTAWTILAGVVAVANAQDGGIATMLLLTAAFIAALIAIVRPLLARVRPAEPGLLVLLFAAAAVSELIGIHAVFGAFLAGLIAPLTADLRSDCGERLAIVTPTLLPLFFAYVGLRMKLTLLFDAESALVCLAVIAVATAGKLGGTALAARATGMTWRAGLALGALMNTRGLMELLAVNIAYDIGIITARMFAILVVMALVTTVATGPLLTLFQSRDAEGAHA